MSDSPIAALRGGRTLLTLFLAGLLLLLVGRWGIGFYVDWLWFSAEGHSAAFRTRFLWEGGARLVTGLIAGVASWFAIRPLVHTLSRLRIRRRLGDLVIAEQLPVGLIRGTAVAAALFLGLWFAAALPAGTGLRFLLLWHSEATGVTDPFFGRDLRFYLFLLPVLQGTVFFGLVLIVFVAAISAAGFAATGGIQVVRGRFAMDGRTRVHFAILGGVFLLFVALRFYLLPYGLVVEGNSGVQGIFGYADEAARVPAFRLLGFLSLAAGALLVWGGVQNRLWLTGASVAGLALASISAGEVYPALVQRFQVEPNELARERPYIEAGIAATRTAFGVDGVERQRLAYHPPTSTEWGEAADRLSRLPVWTEGTLLTTFRQLEARFQYYEFQEVAFDRYPSGDGFEPVAVAVREVNPLGIPDPNWQNLHLRELYISGMGAVAGQLHRQTADGRLPMFLTAIPPEYRPGPGVPDDLELRRPSVYVGSRPQLYAIINPSEEAFLAPGGTPGVPGTDFPQGIRMGSTLRTAALAWRFQDWNLLFASELGAESRFLFRRDVTSRVQALAPFLHLPEAPYPILADGRIIWILEGFTLSNSYPLARAHELDTRRRVNYVRNSVKATVDAVTGEVNLYVADPDDPVLAAYRRAFPGLFRELAEVPPEVGRHFRYSRSHLDLQTRVLARYHQTDPAVFHGQQDRWTLATELSAGSRAIEYRPEYSLLTLPGEEEEHYVLSTLFVPQGRQNLASFLAARWEVESGARLQLWDLPLEDQFPGPRQVEALVEQDPEISQQFSLWRQGGSQVWTGHLHLVPVGNTLLYMEPIFLAADDNAIPEIRRYVVSDGRRVVMDPTIQGAVVALAAGMEGVVRGEVELEEEGEIRLVPAPTTPSSAREALDRLEEAERRLRSGDWEGFGRALEELRELLRRQAGTGG